MNLIHFHLATDKDEIKLSSYAIVDSRALQGKIRAPYVFQDGKFSFG